MDIAADVPKTIFLAGDEASLYLQATTTRVWAPIGQTPLVHVHAGRDKTNFYGALNVHSGKEIVMRTDKLNSDASARYLELVLKEHPDVPILLLWDRAPWHFGKPVKNVLTANPRLEVMCFPTASPELNPQEHVWKAARKAVSHNHILTSLPELADRFQHHLESNTFESSFLDKYGYTTVPPRSN